MLNEEVAKYRKLSGDKNPDTPISRIGGYLDGYERALAKRKTGKWIEKSVITKDEAEKCIEEWQSAQCNQCGKYHTTPYMYYFDIYKFCPNCGSYNGVGESDE